MKIRLAPALLAGCSLMFGMQAAHADEIRVGVIASFSGPYSSWGKHIKEATDLYVAQQGGKAGNHTVKIIYKDVGGNNPARARQLAEELVVRDKVQYIAGLEFTPTAMAVADVATQARVPTVINNSGTSGVLARSPYLLRSGYTQWMVATPLAKWTAEQGVKRVFLAAADYAPGNDALIAYRKAFTEAGGTIVGELRVPLNTTDFSTYMQKAKEARPHHLEWAENPDWAYGGGMYRIACDYRLMIDNLMDLTHETYVHASSIGQKEIDEAPVTTRVEGDEVVTSRFMDNIGAPPFWRMALRGNDLPDDQPVDRWQICHFLPPSHVLIEVGVALAGKGGYHADPKYKASSIVVDFITPETETSHWYFWGMARNFKPHDPELTDSIRAGQGNVFSEDREMLERQQANLLRWPERKLLMLNIDAGGVQSRRIIERILAEERAGTAATA